MEKPLIEFPFFMMETNGALLTLYANMIISLASIGLFIIYAQF